MEKRLLTQGYHALFWAGYAVYYYAVNRLDNDAFSWQNLLVYIPSFALIFYGVWAIADRHFRNGINVQGIIYLITFYAGFMMLASILFFMVLPRTPLDLTAGALREYSFGGYMQTLVVIVNNYSVYALAYFWMRRSVQNARAKQAEAEAKALALERLLYAERDKRHYEYLSLSSQVSPHFIANLLNGWMARLGRGYADVVAAMRGAYGLMVYYMEARLPHKRRVPLTMEIQQLETFTGLLTRDQGKYIRLDAQGRFEGCTIPPTTLLTMLENAVKHGHSDLAGHPIRMEVTERDHRLRCICRNAIKKVADGPSHGVGLSNLTRRLELEYGNNFQLKTRTTSNEYQVELAISY